MNCQAIKEAFERGAGAVLEVGDGTGVAVRDGHATLLPAAQQSSGKAWPASETSAFRCAAPRESVGARRDGGCGPPLSLRRPYILITGVAVAGVLVCVLCGATQQPPTIYAAVVAAAVATATVVAWTVHSYWSQSWLGAMLSCENGGRCVEDALAKARRLYDCPEDRVATVYWVYSSISTLAAGSLTYIVTKRAGMGYSVRLIAVFCSSIIALLCLGLVFRGSWNPFIANCAPTKVVLDQSAPAESVKFSTDAAAEGAELTVHTDGARVTGMSCVA